MEVPVKTIMSVDQKHRVKVMRRDDGLYRFVQESQFTENGETFWTPTHDSGLFDKAEVAEREAQVWLNSKSSTVT